MRGARWRKLGAIALLLGGLAGGAARAEEPELLVFGAASLTNALDEIGPLYTRETQQAVKLSYASSSALARQLEAGAKADAFVSADLEWMDYVQARGLIDTATRRNLLSNRLALIAPAGSTVKLEIKPGFPLAAALAGGRLATGDPDYVPVGRYARSALTSLGVWSDVADHLVRADNVRVALAFVSRGEAPLGIVYQTDALSDPGVRTLGALPGRYARPDRLPGGCHQGRAPGRRALRRVPARSDRPGHVPTTRLHHAALSGGRLVKISWRTAAPLSLVLLALSPASAAPFYVQGSWVITGEPHRYNMATASFQMPRPYTPAAWRSGWGAWELALRYSHTDLDYRAGGDGTPAALDAVRGGVQDVWTFGLNWYLNSNFRMSLDYYRVDVDRLNPAGPGNPTPFGPVPATPPLGVEIGQEYNVFNLRSQFNF